MSSMSTSLGPKLNANYARLRSAWLQEQFAPEILEYQTEAVQYHLGQLEIVEQRLEESKIDTTELKSHAQIYEMENERIKYVLRCYLKLRIKKIEKFFMHILKSANLMRRLSPKEQEYLKSYTDLVGGHMHESFLTQLPEQYQSQIDENMMRKPIMDRHVFIRVKEPIGAFQLDALSAETITLNKNDIYVIRYRLVAELLRLNQIELI